MYYLIYLSSSRSPFSPAQLDALLQQAQSKNRELGITGLLIHRDGNFIQYLEGEQEAVRQLYAKISEDVRHSNLITLSEGPLQSRLFEAWAMEVRPYSGQPIFTPDEVARDATGIKALLDEFIKGLR